MPSSTLASSTGNFITIALMKPGISSWSSVTVFLSVSTALTLPFTSYTLSLAPSDPLWQPATITAAKVRGNDNQRKAFIGTVLLSSSRWEAGSQCRLPASAQPNHLPVLALPPSVVHTAVTRAANLFSPASVLPLLPTSLLDWPGRLSCNCRSTGTP